MKPTLVVVFVHMKNNIQLFEAVDAVCLLALFLGTSQRRQEHRSEDGDNGDDHQQLNQGETLLHSYFSFRLHLFVVYFVNADIILFICFFEIGRPIGPLRPSCSLIAWATSAGEISSAFFTSTLAPFSTRNSTIPKLPDLTA